VARYELLIDGRRRWKAASEADVRRWLAEYCAEHAEDDPGATHVQVMRLAPFSWLTGGASLVEPKQFLDAPGG
jgi:phenylpyruvate tautomerase PptA (4-oxalocrotonate tautomerase family)